MLSAADTPPPPGGRSDAEGRSDAGGLAPGDGPESPATALIETDGQEVCKGSPSVARSRRMRKSRAESGRRAVSRFMVSMTKSSMAAGTRAGGTTSEKGTGSRVQAQTMTWVLLPSGNGDIPVMTS